MPLGLLRNGDYAPSYFRNVTIPTAHKNTDVSRQGTYASDPGRLVWKRSGRLMSAGETASLQIMLIVTSLSPFLNDFVLVENMWHWSYPRGH